MLQYEFYKNWGTEHYLVELNENQISCTTLKDKQATKTKVILLQDIATIKLTKNEAFGSLSYQCDVKSKNGDLINFCTWGEEKNHKEYLQFIVELHKSCINYPAIKFQQPFQFHLTFFFKFIAAVIVISLITSWWGNYEFPKNIMLFLGIIFSLFAWLLRNILNQSYEARKIPKELLPVY